MIVFGWTLDPSSSSSSYPVNTDILSCTDIQYDILYNKNIWKPKHHTHKCRLRIYLKNWHFHLGTRASVRSDIDMSGSHSVFKFIPNVFSGVRFGFCKGQSRANQWLNHFYMDPICSRVFSYWNRKRSSPKHCHKGVYTPFSRVSLYPVALRSVFSGIKGPSQTCCQKGVSTYF